MIILGVFLLIISVSALVFGKAVADLVSEKESWQQSIFSKFKIDGFWGCKDYSWIRKDHKNKIINWLLHNPLVFLTDCWHLANTIQRMGIYLGIVSGIIVGMYSNPSFISTIVIMGIYILLNVIGFHFMYHKFLRKKA